MREVFFGSILLQIGVQVGAITLICKYVKIEKWKVVALTGRRNGGAYSFTQGDALG
jgi:hypothetical protein